MKFLVGSLPYYEDYCPFLERCWAEKKTEKCPRYWDKYKVCSNENPHECKYLIEQTGEQYD